MSDSGVRSSKKLFSFNKKNVAQYRFENQTTGCPDCRRRDEGGMQIAC